MGANPEAHLQQLAVYRKKHGNARTQAAALLARTKFNDCTSHTACNGLDGLIRTCRPANPPTSALPQADNHKETTLVPSSPRSLPVNTQAIGSTASLPNLYALGSLQATSAITQASGTQSTGISSGIGGVSDSAAISPLGQFLSNLQQLQQQNPSQLQQILSKTASQISSLATQNGQTGQAKYLNNLANQLQDAAQTGNVSALEPSQGGHHHHHRAQAAYGQNNQSQQQSQLGSLLSAGQTATTSTATQNSLSSIFASLTQAVSSALSG
jgi:hypothetical protein